MIPFDTIRRTSNDKLAGTIRLFLAILFLMTGAMKLLVPTLAEAWAGQLIAANIPFYILSRWSVPFVEIAVGVALAVGAFARLTVVVVIGIMVVATYVHFVVDDPSLFPLQPSEPVIPLIVIALSLYILWRGAGSWSFMTGAMKLLVPTLAEAWAGQLIAANIPFYILSRWSVPFVEIAVGVALAVGAFARLTVVVVIGIMVVATYVHFVVDDPSLFPLQPSEPVIPLIVIALSLYILWRGAGSWSKDLLASPHPFG